MARAIEHINVDQAIGTTATLVAAKAGYKIMVTEFMLAVTGGATPTKSTLQDETANTVRVTLAATTLTTPTTYNGGSGASDPAFETAVGEGLELVTGTNQLVSGFLNFQYSKQ